MRCNNSPDTMTRFSASRLLQACLTLFAALVLLTAGAARAEEEFLDPAQAFRFAARMADPQTLEVSYQIADGYYMYRERFGFKADGATLGMPQIPPGKVKYDPTFEKDVETHMGLVTIRIPVEGSGNFTLTATSQGCADAGLCYPPQQHTAQLSAGAGGLSSGALSAAGVEDSGTDIAGPCPVAAPIGSDGAPDDNPPAPALSWAVCCCGG